MDERRVQDSGGARKPGEAKRAGEEKPARKTESGAEVARKVANGAVDEAADRTGRYR